MDAERIKQILSAGNNAAINALSKRPQKQEYPRDFKKLYEFLEHNLYSFFDAKHNRDLAKINRAAGEIVMTASEVAEFSKNEAEWERMVLGEVEDGNDG